jgi:hypothetical protein
MQTDTPNNNTEDTTVDATPQAGPQTEPLPEPFAETQDDAPATPQAEPQAEPQEGDSVVAKKAPPKTAPPKKSKRKRHPIKSLLRILLALVLIAGGIYLILFIVAYASRYDSIASMLERMFDELSLMWQRIRN